MKNVYEKRKFKEFLVTPVGLGGIPLQRLSQDECLNVFKKCFENGLNFIDSAKGYTVSEEKIGKSLELLNINRNDIFLATKSFSRTYELMKEDIETSLRCFKTSYIDLYQFHNVKTKEEFLNIINENGSYKALSEAKEKGLIKYIGITSHSYDFLNWLVDSEYNTMVDSIQFPYNFIESDALKLFQKAKSLNICTIAMKPLAGGTIDKGSIAIKYLLRDSNLTVCIPGLSNVGEVEDVFGIKDLNYDSYEEDYMKNLIINLEGNFCHRCGYCMPCTKGIDISGVFTLEKYYLQYDLKDWAKTRYFNQKVLPSECIDCKKCQNRCPYNLDIPTKLKKIVNIFEKNKS